MVCPWYAGVDGESPSVPSPEEAPTSVTRCTGRTVPCIVSICGEMAGSRALARWPSRCSMCGHELPPHSLSPLPPRSSCRRRRLRDGPRLQRRTRWCCRHVTRTDHARSPARHPRQGPRRARMHSDRGEGPEGDRLPRRRRGDVPGRAEGLPGRLLVRDVPHGLSRSEGLRRRRRVLLRGEEQDGDGGVRVRALRGVVPRGDGHGAALVHEAESEERDLSLDRTFGSLDMLVSLPCRCRCTCQVHVHVDDLSSTCTCT